MSYWLGVDTGGTFTDFVLLGEATPRIHKVLSTPAAPEEAILQGIREMGLEDRLRAGELVIVHGTTVATNAALESKGARTVLVTNRGLEDVLLIGRQNRPELYNLTPSAAPTALADTPVERLSARLGADGTAVTGLNDADIDDLVARVRAHDPESVAVNLLFAYLDPDHEERLGRALEDAGLAVSLSSRVLPTRGEYERGMATWLNAWLAPRIHHYISRLKAHTAPSPLTIMQSNGGTVAADQAAGRAVNLLLSGPAGGLSAAHRLGGALGEDHLMTFDMGGTSTDVALLDGDIRLTQSGHIGPYPVAVPMVDMHTIGAGGGSLARVDDAGLLHVGPQSAGADPGPACYGKGGQEPTVTDANLVLGRLQPEFALGGSLALDRGAAEAAVARVARSLGLDTVSAARGIIELANEHMSQALRVISIQKGFDPADFQLVSFGGAGGLHVCALAENLGMRRAVMPIRAGVLSAEGLVYAPRKRELIQALPGGADAARVNALAADLDRRGRRELASEGVPDSDVVTEVTLDLCYQGQSSTLGLPWDGDPEAAETAFHRLHEHRYGHRLALPVQRVNVRVRCQAPARPPAPAPLAGGDGAPAWEARLPGVDGPVPIYRRDNLAAGQVLRGPALVFEAVGTVYLAPGWQAQVHSEGHLLMTR
ncbi:MAG: hydantoinase/oxoprolinase family protein [Pseudomonadota bacterium]|uniref:hydantoinase/oxoprolinase family protein n=1 Tax=Alloalcanivorax venustensis TaxID=172371 RepID=UPI002EB3ABD1|nr:hydantoinase/oxoprolinase family protein [Pseudomonadota bacterium]|tara:strand:+ start:35775 stop:37739 length:1965 start_codon:yes stop_codon:yes gene_type:complete